MNNHKLRKEEVVPMLLFDIRNTQGKIKDENSLEWPSIGPLNNDYKQIKVKTKKR